MKPVLLKLFRVGRRSDVKILKEQDAIKHNNGDAFLDAWIIPQGGFSPEEIEELREYDKEYLKEGFGHFIANFLPDEIRPEGVPKM